MSAPTIKLNTGKDGWTALYNNTDCSKWCEQLGQCDFCGDESYCCSLNPPHQNTQQEHQKMICGQEQLNSVLMNWVTTEKETSCVVKKETIKQGKYVLGHEGQDCWGKCGGKAGQCAWCGKDGACCTANHGLRDTNKDGVNDCTADQIDPILKFARSQNHWGHVCSTFELQTDASDDEKNSKTTNNEKLEWFLLVEIKPTPPPLRPDHAKNDIRFQSSSSNSVSAVDLTQDISAICPLCPLHYIYTGRCGVLEGCEALLTADGRTSAAQPASSLNVHFAGEKCTQDSVKNGFVMQNTLRVQGAG